MHSAWRLGLDEVVFYGDSGGPLDVPVQRSPRFGRLGATVRSYVSIASGGPAVPCSALPAPQRSMITLVGLGSGAERCAVRSWDG